MNINLNDFVKQLYKQANEKDLEIEIGMQHFLSYQKSNKRPATFKYYELKFNQILNYFDTVNVHNFSQINNEVLINYISYMQSINNKPATINKMIGAIKTLINYLEELEMIEHINIKIKKLKEQEPKIEIIDVETLQEVITYLNEHKPVQHRLVFQLMLATGIRRTELIFIKRCNIDLDNNSIYLERTKTGPTRYIYFDNLIKELIIHELTFKPTSKYLFVNDSGGQISTATIDSIFQRTKKELNINMLSPHKLRHTYATMIMQQEKDIEQVRLLLGHSTYNMTKRYLHLTNNQLKETSLKCNPLNALNRA